MLWWTRYNIQQYRKATTTYERTKAISEMVYTIRKDRYIQFPTSPCYFISCEESAEPYMWRLK